MNIVITTDYFPPHVGGGVEVVTYHLGSELVRLGHNVSVVTLNTRKGQRVEELNGIRIYRAHPIELTEELGIQSALSVEAVKLIRDVCLRERADVLHANNLYFFTTIAACAISKFQQQPMVTTLHVAATSHLEGGIRWLANVYDRSIGRWILDGSEHVVAVSKAVMRYARELGVASSRISVVPNGVDLEEFNPARKVSSNNIVRIGFVGRLISNKGPQYLLEAAAQVLKQSPRIEFLLVGDGPMRRQLERRVSELGLVDRVHFLGVVPSVSEFLKNCDVFVRPSLTEGMPLTVLEAMACGVPTVASSVGGTPELIADGVTGLLTEPRNIKQLRDCLLRLAGDEELRRCIGKQGRAYVEKHHNWRNVAKEMDGVYRQVSGLG